MHTCTHTLFIKLNPTPITFYVAPNQCDYWEKLNVRSPKKNKHICNILIFQNIFETIFNMLCSHYKQYYPMCHAVDATVSAVQ